MRKLLAICVVTVSLMFMAFTNRGMVDIPENYLLDTLVVKATIYKPYKRHNITADGFRFGDKNAGKYRIVAISPDLKKKYPFGTRVFIAGTGDRDGFYVVKDLMSSRFKKKIDILVDKSASLNKYSNVYMYKISDDYFCDGAM